METYIYKCPECGFAHQVPAYWVSFNPESTMEFEHMRFKTGDNCENRLLNLKEED